MTGHNSPPTLNVPDLTVWRALVAMVAEFGLAGPTSLMDDAGHRLLYRIDAALLDDAEQVILVGTEPQLVALVDGSVAYRVRVPSDCRSLLVESLAAGGVQLAGADLQATLCEAWTTGELVLPTGDVAVVQARLASCASDAIDVGSYDRAAKLVAVLERFPCNVV